MTDWRIWIHHRRGLAMLIIACALLIKAVIPSGYMLTPAAKTLTVQICSEGIGAGTTKTITIAMDRADGSTHDPAGKHGGDHDGDHDGDGQCAFSSLAMAGMAGADALHLAEALAFILLLGFAPAAFPLPSRAAHLRPPLRGPPLFA